MVVSDHPPDPTTRPTSQDLTNPNPVLGSTTAPQPLTTLPPSSFVTTPSPSPSFTSKNPSPLPKSKSLDDLTITHVSYDDNKDQSTQHPSFLKGRVEAEITTIEPSTALDGVMAMTLGIAATKGTNPLSLDPAALSGPIEQEVRCHDGEKRLLQDEKGNPKGVLGQLGDNVLLGQSVNDIGLVLQKLQAQVAVIQQQRLATWMCCGSSKAKTLKKEKIAKCSESMWKLTYYATVEACILTMTYHEPWFKEGQGYFMDWPNQEFKDPLKLFFMCQCGFYIFSIVALLTWETRRKDFAVMMSHHVITVILIGYCYVMRFFRVGSVLFALHDASDVFLEAAKIFKYSENEIGASVCFGCFAVSWLILRLIFFPFWVIKATSVDLSSYLRPLEAYGVTLYYMLNAMLLTLLVFHIYWFKLICAMLLRLLKNQGKVGEDIRSDSEDD